MPKPISPINRTKNIFNVFLETLKVIGLLYVFGQARNSPHALLVNSSAENILRLGCQLVANRTFLRLIKQKHS